MRMSDVVTHKGNKLLEIMGKLIYSLEFFGMLK
jgi:hypothetical protein